MRKLNFLNDTIPLPLFRVKTDINSKKIVFEPLQATINPEW